jgi:hypothetical protein
MTKAAAIKTGRIVEIRMIFYSSLISIIGLEVVFIQPDRNAKTP